MREDCDAYARCATQKVQGKERTYEIGPRSALGTALIETLDAYSFLAMTSTAAVALAQRLRASVLRLKESTAAVDSLPVLLS